jgi:hypothetical protein
MVLIGGMTANVGIKGDEEASLYRMMGRSGPGDHSVLICLGGLCEAQFGLVGLDIWPLETVSFRGPAGNELGFKSEWTAFGFDTGGLSNEQT